MTRTLSINIQAADERGFFVQEDGHIVACFTSASEVAEWVRVRLLDLDGHSTEPLTGPPEMPSVVRRATLWRQR